MRNLNKRNKGIDGRPGIADVGEECICGHKFTKVRGVMRSPYTGDIIICEKCNKLLE
ncbi:MAG: hypothetical protein QHH15_00460 [Candidatus Thermoplasmatota archaeon]|nr:hypothetical protein [Candidatus Thermoplasmatota archaeon]MDH7506246.1 hypothetical protein [Candidatus Thermoplasmatota archaeon]